MRLLGLALCLLCWACRSAEDPDPTGPTRVAMWMFGGVPEQEEWLRKAVAKFNARHSHIRIEFENRDWATQRESLITTTIAGEGPDIIRVHHKYSVEFGELGGLYALENFPDFPQVRERILDNLWEHVEYDGRHYGLPISVLPFVLAVNKEILAARGLEVPRTWEEMLAMGPALKQEGLHTFTMPGGVNQDTAYRFLPLLYKAGGRIFNEDWSAAAFNGPAGVAALEFLVQMKERGFMPDACAAYAFDENAAHWVTGRAAFSIEGPWWQNAVLGNYGFDLDKLALAQVPGPAEPCESNPSRTLLDVVMVAITGYTRVPEAAWFAIKELWLEDPAWQVPEPAMSGLPAQKVAYEPGVESAFIGMEALAEAGRNGLAWPGHPGITEIQRHMADAVNMALTGAMSPQEALDAAAAEVDEILSDY